MSLEGFDVIKNDTFPVDKTKITFFQKLPVSLEVRLLAGEGEQSLKDLKKGIPASNFEMFLDLKEYGTTSLPIGSDKGSAEAKYTQLITKIKEGKYRLCVLGYGQLSIEFL